ALSARVLLRAAYSALSWAPPRAAGFPDASPCEQLGCAELEEACAMGVCCTTFELACEDPIANEPDASREQLFQRGVGAFLKNAERGFRGLDFQARLIWEDRFGACEKLDPDAVDFIDRTVAA